MLAMLVAGLGFQGVRVLRGRGPGAIQALAWHSDGRWWLQDRSGREVYVQPQPSRCWGPLLWLRWHCEGRRRLLIIDGAVVEPNQWRRLKAELKLGRS